MLFYIISIILIVRYHLTNHLKVGYIRTINDMYGKPILGNNISE